MTFLRALKLALTTPEHPNGKDELKLRQAQAKLKLPAVAAVMYLVVSGGPYGLEEALGAAGPVITLLLCLTLPFVLSIPVALMAAELTALFPWEGGCYFWVKEAFGPFLGFAEAYLTILYTAVDMAIYPVLFAAYLSFIFPMSSHTKLAFELAVIWGAGLLNLAGIRPTGQVSLVLSAAVLVPFIGLAAFGSYHLNAAIKSILVSADSFSPRIGAAPLTAALTVLMWNFCGWENLSTAAGELEHPQRNYLRAVLIVVPLVCASYLLPVILSASMLKPDSGWTLGSFVELGRNIGGGIGATAVAIGGAISSFAVFEASLLCSSRLPFVLALEGYLPLPLTAVWQRTETPALAILLSCTVFSLLLPLGFSNLVALDVMFYMGGLALELAALVRLRKLRPMREGLFIIGGGKTALYLTVSAPLALWMVTLLLAMGDRSTRSQALIGALLVVGCIPIYKLCKRLYGGALQADKVTNVTCAVSEPIVQSTSVKNF